MFLLVLIVKTFATHETDESDSIQRKRRNAFLVVGAATTAASGIGYVHLPFSKSYLLTPTELAMFKAISSIYGTDIPSNYIESFIKWSAGSGVFYFLTQGVVKLNFVPPCVKNHIFLPKEVFTNYLSSTMKFPKYLNNPYFESIQDMYYENTAKLSALFSDILSGIRINFDWPKFKSIGKSIFNCFGIFDGGLKSAATAGVSTATLGTAYIYLIEKIYSEKIEINSMTQDEFMKYYEESFHK